MYGVSPSEIADPIDAATVLNILARARRRIKNIINALNNEKK